MLHCTARGRYHLFEYNLRLSNRVSSMPNLTEFAVKLVMMIGSGHKGEIKPNQIDQENSVSTQPDLPKECVFVTKKNG